MGIKASRQLKDSNLVFLGAGGSSERDAVCHLFSSPHFGATVEERYDYFDALLNDDDELKLVVKEMNIEWPSSVEILESQSFLENVTTEQASALLKHLLK